MSGWIVDDAARLKTLRAFGILDSDGDARFDAIAADAAALCAAPVALVSLVDRERQWFKARVGTDMTETPIELAICVHALAHGELLVIPDLAADPRTVDNRLVIEPPHVRFYAGVPLVADGQAIGTLCVLDVVPRPAGLDAAERAGLETLAARAMALIAAT